MFGFSEPTGRGSSSWRAGLSCGLLQLRLPGCFAGFDWCVVALLVEWGCAEKEGVRGVWWAADVRRVGMGGGCGLRRVDAWIDMGLVTMLEIFA